ncbi:MAG: hypothetical protein JXR66_08480 [Bacteroidales bacterium]|nr:hypothetical protein [Bacteroidales bacterium]
MKTSDIKKKVWAKPEVHVLNIKKDTFTGVSLGGENTQQPNSGALPRKV